MTEAEHTVYASWQDWVTLGTTLTVTVVLLAIVICALTALVNWLSADRMNNSRGWF